MSYRTYLGYINKSELKNIRKEVSRLKKLIGKPKSDNTDEVYSQYDITKYMTNQAVYLIGFDKLYYMNNDTLEKLLYDNTTENFSDEDTEFYFINEKEKHFFYKLALAYQNMWIEYCNKVNCVLEKILKTDKKVKLTEQEIEILEIVQQTNTIEKNYYTTAEKQASYNNFDFKPFNKYQFNYIAVQIYLNQRDADFDYENKILCFWGN